jgi:CelD/BcsL family acetyltransferase involved in cellulose biosynthesis
MTQLAPASISVEEVTDRAAIAALAPEWERLRAQVAAAGGAAGPFLGPTWFAIWAASIAERLRILVAHRGGRLVGVLPLLHERRRLAGLPARVLRSLSDDHSQRFDVLLDPAEPDLAAHALWQKLRLSTDWDALELREIPDGDSGAARLMAQARAAGHATASWPAMCSPYLALSEPPFGSSKLRSNLRRRVKKLELEVGPVTLERISERGADLEQALDEGFALEAAGWKGERGTAIACDPALRARYRQLAHAFAARGELAVHFLRAGPRRVAFHFALFKPGFDPSLSSYGLGHLLLDAVARDAHARGLGEIDFLGDDLPWKRDWTEQKRAHSWRYAFSRSPYGRALGAWKFQVAPALKRLLRPERA